MRILNRRTKAEREVTPGTWSRMVATGQAKSYKVVKEQPEAKLFQRIEEPVVQEEEKPKRRRRAFEIEEEDTNQTL
jgi:hypothetical protein